MFPRSLCLAVVLCACSSTAPVAAPATSGPPAAAAASVAPQPRLTPAVVSLPPYELAAGTLRLIGSLKEPLQIDAYVTRGTPHLDDYVEGLTSVLQAYERSGQGKVRIRILEPATMAEAEQARAAGLSEQRFTSASKRGDKAASNGYLGLSFKYRDQSGAIPELPPDSDGGSLEFWVTSKIRDLRDRADGIQRRVGVVSGKAELKLSDRNLVPVGGAKGSPSLQSVLSEAFPFYSIEEVDLHGGANAIDNKLVGIIVTQPQKDYSEQELRRIDEFLMLGKKGLAVFASAVNLAAHDAKMAATLSTHGLEPLLAGYGISMGKNIVLDFGASFRFQKQPNFRYPPIPHVFNDPGQAPAQAALDSTFPPFFRLDELTFPFASSLEFDRRAQPAEVAMRPVAVTTPAAMLNRTSPLKVSPAKEWTNVPPNQRHVVAAVVEGKLQSAFASRPSTLVPLSVMQATEPSRVLVVSSSLFLTNPFAYAGNPRAGKVGTPASTAPELAVLAQEYTKHLTSMILVFKNTLDWLASEDDVIALTARIGSGRSPATRK